MKGSRLERTPRLEERLRSLRGRLRVQVLLWGIGTVLGVGVGWLAFAYLADWGLRVPRPVRLLHGVAFLALLAVFVWRDLLRPLSRLPRRPGLALLFERRDPKLHELLISAVQFQQRGAEAGDPELVDHVLAQADRRAAELQTAGVLDSEAPRARFLLGVGGLVATVFFCVWKPEHASIFVDRMLGGSATWPQRTHLRIEIPGIDSVVRAEREPDRIHLRVARGTDVPIVVTADGVVPDEVRLHFEDSRDLVLNATGGNVFRTLLRSCQEDVGFHATGGDDTDGRPRVEIEVLQPPDVEGVAVAIRPPAYSGVPDSIAFNRDVEVLAGSRLRVHALPFPADAIGRVRLLPADTTLDLSPAPYPIDPSDPAPSDDVTRDGLAFDLIAETSIGFRIELVDASGLTNPDPGLFRIQVAPDRPPELRVLAPSRTEFEIVRGGAVPLRARAEDDFGLVSMRWRVLPGGAVGDDAPAPVLEGVFEHREIARSENERAGDARSPHAALGTVRLEVDALGTEETPVAVDQRYVFEITALDNREPEPNVGQALPIRARVVTPEELLRRMQERLARARMDALRLSDLQREKLRRVEELLDSLESDGGAPGAETVAMAAALSGQRRVLGDAQALARDLAAVAEDILYARLDEKGGALLAAYDQAMEQVTDLAFRPEPWRDLAAAADAGRLGAAGFARSLVELVGLALEISEDHVRAAAGALDRAEREHASPSRARALAEAAELQGRSLERMEDLLAELAEWDNFQNVLALTRDILNRQKALRERTQQYASEK